MNILFFLSPKQDLMYVYDDFTLRQTLEKWENNRYASFPALSGRRRIPAPYGRAAALSPRGTFRSSSG